MTIILTLDSFDGYHFLARNNETDILLQQYIDRFEASFIKKILGVTLGELFIADIQGVDSDSAAIEERFQTILDPFTKQPRHKIHESKGMEDILASLVFYEYVFDQAAKHTQSGVTLAQSETSQTFSPENQATFAENKFNDALPSIWAVQWWCRDEDRDNYPEYNGQKFYPTNPLI